MEMCCNTYSMITIKGMEVDKIRIKHKRLHRHIRVVVKLAYKCIRATKVLMNNGFHLKNIVVSKNTRPFFNKCMVGIEEFVICNLDSILRHYT